MGIITPAHNIDRFNAIKEKRVREATDDFYRLCQKSDYIRVDRIARILSGTMKVLRDLEGHHQPDQA